MTDDSAVTKVDFRVAFERKRQEIVDEIDHLTVSPAFQPAPWAAQKREFIADHKHTLVYLDQLLREMEEASPPGAMIRAPRGFLRIVRTSSSGTPPMLRLFVGDGERMLLCIERGIPFVVIWRTLLARGISNEPSAP
jgi:hypothetical protein